MRVRAATVVCALAALAPAAAAQPSEPDAGALAMMGLEGPYSMSREGSGTSWQPDSTPISGLHAMRGAWMTMVHGQADLVYDHQGGPGGATQSVSSSMLMLMARRELEHAALGVHVMASTDPLMGASGYPLLFQTGETANGRDPLIDRQHPHDLLMEAAATYSLNLRPQTSLFVYAGLPGEPALGPSAFMHRLSGMDEPEAPLSHHWLDSTHICFGVVTGGYTWRQLRLEASRFNGRDPTRDWSLQGSFGRLASPDQLQPGVAVRRGTASASYNAPLALWWQTTLAWGRNAPSSGPSSNAWLLESALKLRHAHTLFGRLERVTKDELFLPGAALYGRSFTINKLSLGYIFDFARLGALDLGLGGLISIYSYPAILSAAYGTRPTSFMVFVRARL